MIETLWFLNKFDLSSVKVSQLCIFTFDLPSKKKQKKKKKNKLALCLGLQKEEREPEDEINLDDIKGDGDDDAVDRAIFQSKLQKPDENCAAATSLGSEEAGTTFVEIHL